MKIKLLLLICLFLSRSVANAQSVVVNKILNNTSSMAGGTVNGPGDGVEFLVLEDHTDLRGAYFKDFFNMNTATTDFVEGSQWQLSNDVIWSDLRSGTTIVFIRPATSPVAEPAIITDLPNYKLQFPLAVSASAYVNQITSPTNTFTFNPQGRDGIVLKRGTSPDGFDNLIHFCITGFSSISASLQAAYNAINGPKMALGDILPGSTSGTGTNGYLYARNPTAENTPENGIVDYLGIDENPKDILGWFQRNSPGPFFGEGEPNSANIFNQKFVEYLRASPKIESIIPVTSPVSSSSVVFNVVFSKAVTVIAMSDFELELTGTAIGKIATVTGSGTNYQVTVNQLSGTGGVRIIKKANNVSISDGVNKMFNGFAYTKSAFHNVDLQIVLAKPNAPIIGGNNNGLATNLSPRLSGETVANAFINLFLDGNRINAVIRADANGNWNYTLATPLSVGVHSFYITVSVQNVTSVASDVVSANFVPYVSGIPASARSVVINKVFNAGSTADDAVELLVLDDHVDLSNLYIKDMAGNTSTSTEYNDNGGKYKFRETALWTDLRSGTTILLKRNPTSGYVLDTDASDRTIEVSLDDTNYFTNESTASFNIQNYDMVVLKGGSNASGYDNIIHALISAVNSNTKDDFDSFPEPKMGINALVPTTNGFLFANTPIALTAAHNAISDFSGYVNTDRPTTVTAGTTVTYIPEPPILRTSFNDVVPAYHIGEIGGNRTLITYLRTAPKIENIIPARPSGKQSSVLFTLTFNKAVTGVDIADFRLLATQTANGVISTVTGSGSVYQILVTELSGNGQITIVKRASGTSITDGTNLFLNGFEYLKCNPYFVDDLPVVIPVPAAPIVDGAVNNVSFNFLPLISGTVRVGVNVNLYIDNVLVNATITSNAVGAWSYQIVTPLSVGTHSFYITTSASFGTSEKSADTVVDFIIRTPTSPIVTEAINGATNALKPNLTGTAIPNATVNLFIDGQPVQANIIANGNGIWNYYLEGGISQGTHTFRVSVTTAFGTSGLSESTTVLFKLYSGQILVNNILTPNGDGKNDFWKIENLEMYPINEVLVFDKMGKMVYRQKNYQQDWDGSFEGVPLNSGTYYYQISFGPDLNPLKGYLTILKAN
jgi:gliding motility-associated-like protein